VALPSANGIASKPNMRKALVPISVDNRSFRTSVLVAALKPILRECDEVVFLIADRLQVYNKVRRLAQGGIGAVLEHFDSVSKAHYEQRCKWLERVRSILESDGYKCEHWRVLGVQDVTDGAFYAIFRNVFLATQAVDALAQDIRDALGRRVGAAGAVSRDARLCEAYLIEEIAVNIRLRVYEGIESEFYFGDTLAPLLGLYEGAYGVDVFLLAGKSKLPLEFSFFRPVTTNDRVSWMRCHYDGA